MVTGIPSIMTTQELFLFSHFMPPLGKALVTWAIKRFQTLLPAPPGHQILCRVVEKHHASHCKNSCYPHYHSNHCHYTIILLTLHIRGFQDAFTISALFDLLKSYDLFILPVISLMFFQMRILKLGQVTCPRVNSWPKITWLISGRARENQMLRAFIILRVPLQFKLSPVICPTP